MQSGRQYHQQAALHHGQVQPQLHELQDPDKQQEQVQDEPQLQIGHQYHQQAVLTYLPDPSLLHGQVQTQLHELQDP